MGQLKDLLVTGDARVIGQLHANADSANGIHIATMDNNSSTSTAFVVDASGIISLYDGLIIYCKNTKVASASGCTLNVNGLGAKRIWLSQSNGYCTTHWSLNNSYIFIYSADIDMWVLQQGRDSTTTNATQMNYSSTIKCGSTAIVAGNIIVADSNGLYKHLKLGTAFNITWQILYANGAIAASSTSTNVYSELNIPIATTQSLTLTAYKPLYIKGTLSGTTFTPVSTTPVTQTVPSSDDGYAYIYLGYAYSTANFRLVPEHLIYAYKNGKFGLLANDATSVNGYTVAKSVPSDAKFTDTTYESKAAASGGTAVSLVTTGEKYTWNNKSSLTLGNAATNAYYGDKGKTAYDHSQLTSGNPHSVTKTDVGLGNVGNFKAVSTVASQGLTDTEKSNARTNIGAGTSSLTLGTSSTTALKGDTKYAGSSSAGGAATSANKLNTDAGSMLNPVHFSSGVPVASSGNTIPYIVGTGTTAGTWLGTLEGLTAYYDGLIILYKSPVAGASTTTLNLNSLGAKTCYVNNTTKLTTHFPANQPIFLVYSESQNSGCWMCLDDYWSDSNTYTTAWCGTAGNTLAKTASCTNFTLRANTYIPVLMRYTNTINAPITLNINGTGAKPIYINGVQTSSSHNALPAGMYLVYYNGTNYYFRTDEKLTASITGDAKTVDGHSIDTSIGGSSTSTNLPTSQAVASFVEGKGYSTLELGNTATTAAAGNHTHTTNIEADSSGTTTLSMASNTNYKITAGDTEFVFTTPYDKVYQISSTSNGTITLKTIINPSGSYTTSVISIYGLQASAYRGVDTSIADGTTSTKLPTSKAVADYVVAKPTILSGTSEPDTSLGKDGDVYILLD